MKKMIICLLVIGILMPMTYAGGGTSRDDSKTCKSFDELIWWIQSEESELVFDGIYKEKVLELRDSKNFLMPKNRSGFWQVLFGASTNSCNYFYEINGKEMIVYISPMDENDPQTCDEKIEQLRSRLREVERLVKQGREAKLTLPEKSKTITMHNGEQIECIIYDYMPTIHSNGRYVAFIKDDNWIIISMHPDEFDMELVRSVSFEKVSLSEPIDLGYSDVKGIDWFYDDVGYTKFVEPFPSVKEVIPGVTETRFFPNVSADRETIALALWYIEDKPELSRILNEIKFDDVSNSYSIRWATNNGIINGVGDNKFNPEGNVTRQDFAVMLWRYMKHKKFEIPETENAKVFSDDAKISDYAKEAVYTLNTLGIMNGRGNDTIDPRGNVTRAEAAAMLRRMMKVK